VRKIHLLLAYFSSLFLLTVLIIETDTLISLAGFVYLTVYCFIISNLAKSRKLTFSMNLFMVFFGIGHVIKTGFVLLNREIHQGISWVTIGAFDFSFEAMFGLFMVELSALLGGYVCIKLFLTKKSLSYDSNFKSVSRVKSQVLLFGWCVLSIVLIDFIDQLGFGQHGVQPPNALPYGIGGFLVYFRNVAIPLSGLVFLQWYMSVHDKQRWLGYAAYILVAISISYYSLSRSVFIVLIVPLLIVYIGSVRFSLKKAAIVGSIVLVFLISMSMVDAYRSGIYNAEISAFGISEIISTFSINEIFGRIAFIVNRIEGSRELMAVISSDIKEFSSLLKVVFLGGDDVMVSVYGFIPSAEGFAFGMTYGLVGMLYISGSHMVVFFGTMFYLAALFSIERIFLRQGYITGSIFVSFIIFINIWGNMIWFFFFRFFFIAFFVYFMVKFFEVLVLTRRSIMSVRS
jgi:hypothetical protein